MGRCDGAQYLRESLISVKNLEGVGRHVYLEVKMRACLVRLIVVVSFIVLTADAALAQQGQINGVVTDSSGGVLPGVTVTAVESQTGVTRDTVSGASGRYSFVSMRPAQYEVRAQLTGFKSVQRTGITLQADQNLTVNMTLELGELSETITVAGEAAQVDITSATIAEVVDHARIVELPIAGREVARLQTLVAARLSDQSATKPRSRCLAPSGSQPTARASVRTPTGSTVQATPTHTSRRTRAFHFLTHCRSSASRRAITARRTATTLAQSSTS
jgi:hypothetical protein